MINRELTVNQELNCKHPPPPYLDFCVQINFLIQIIRGCATYLTVTKETRLPLRHNPNIEPEQMKALVDLQLSQNDLRTLSDHTHTCFVKNQRALVRTPH